jgi:hypothetical protein
VLPLVLILATLTFAGESSARIIAASRRFLERRWPHLLAGLILIVGAVAILLGATGLASGVPGRTGRFFRGVRRVLHHLRP